MQEKILINWERRWKTRMYMMMLLGTILAIPFISDVFAQGQTVTVRVLVEETAFNGCDDPWSPPDIYWDVYIDGAKHTSVNDPIESNIGPFPVNKEFSQDVDLSKRYISVVIQEWDDDSGLTGDNDKCDINPGGGKDLNLSLDLATCQISGDVSGVCGTSIIVQGGGVGWFKFKVAVQEPPRASGMIMRCLHDPIWPQPGDQVTITSEALDGDANPMTGIVEEIQIWVNSPPTATVSTLTTPGSLGTNLLAFNHTPAPGVDQLVYRCDGKDGSDSDSTGWRIVQIGQPAQGRAVPIVYTGKSDLRSDLVFIADQNDYPGAPNNPQFLTDVHTIIRDAYYAGNLAFSRGGRLYLSNQDAMNFWIALDTGQAVPLNTGIHVLPVGWDTDYSFADSGAIVHTTFIGADYAVRGDRIFSSRPSSPQTFLHEAGHSPVGLADEYCGTTGYFQPNFFPNIYSSQSDCLNDPLASTPNACQQIQSTNCIRPWFRVEDASTVGDDLMACSGGYTANPVDAIHINTYFAICLAGGC